MGMCILIGLLYNIIHRYSRYTVNTDIHTYINNFDCITMCIM